MSGPEIHPAVEAGYVQAHDGDESFRRYVSSDIKSTRLLVDMVQAERRKATRTFLIRAAVAVALVAGLFLAQAFGLIAWQLALPLECAAACWLSVWFGAWLQFMFAKREGLLKC